jgi:predicted nucleotidyltransferase
MYKDDIKNIIISIKDNLKNKYHIKNISLFGSYARDESKEDSDVDLLVDFEQTPDLLTFIEIEEFLSQKLGKKVDLVPARKVKKSLQNRIFSEAIAL